MAIPYLLDTTVLLHWTRASRQAEAVDRRFQLTASELRPLVCEVSLGEMLAFSRSLGWGAQKRDRLAEIERQVVIVHISDRRVMEAYADLSTLAQKAGWSLFHGKNDLWVAAAAKAAGAHRLSMDKDFLPPAQSRRMECDDLGRSYRRADFRRMSADRGCGMSAQISTQTKT